MHPLISVIIPAYNQARYIRQSITSVIAQTYPHLEIIVIDDGSTDETAQLVGNIHDPRLRYFYQENQGLSAARNAGIRIAKGDYFSYLDSDDLFLPDKLKILLNEFKADSKMGMVAGQAIPIDDDVHQIGKMFSKGIPAEGALLLLGNPLHVGSILIKRKWQLRVGFFDENLRSYEDWDMWLRLVRHGCRVGWVDKPVSLYRFHPKQMTRDGMQMTTANFTVLHKIFADPELPEAWQSLKMQAFSQAHLRAAAHGYLAGDIVKAKSNLTQAIDYDNTLLTDQAQPILNRIASWTDLPKTDAPVEFMERVFFNLPEELLSLIDPRTELGKVAVRLAFSSYQMGEPQITKVAVRRAIRSQPKWIFNRGLVSIFFRSVFSSPIKSSSLQKVDIGAQTI
jgi:hypothetical protein